jgi:hypothetical protein
MMDAVRAVDTPVQSRLRIRHARRWPDEYLLLVQIIEPRSNLRAQGAVVGVSPITITVRGLAG